jgi:uncharacterized protein YjdB
MQSTARAWVLVALFVAGCGGGSGAGGPTSPPVTQSGTNEVSLDNSVPSQAQAAITSYVSGAGSVPSTATSINVPTGLGSGPALVLAVSASNSILLIGSPAQDGSITLSPASTAQALAEFGLEPLPTGVTYAQAISAITASAGYSNLVTQVEQALSSGTPPATSPAVLTGLSAVASQAQTAILASMSAAATSVAKGSGNAKEATSKYAVRRAVPSATYQPLPYNLVTANGAAAITVADVPSSVQVQLYNNTFIQWSATTTDINGNNISSVTLPPISLGSYIGNVLTTGAASTPVPIDGNAVQFVVTVSEDSSSVAFDIANVIQTATNTTLSTITPLTGQQKTCVGSTITTLVNSELPALIMNPSVESFKDYLAGVFMDADNLISKCAFSAAQTEEFGPLSIAVAAVQAAVNVSSITATLTQAVTWLGQSFSVEVCKSSGVSIPCSLSIRTPNPFLVVGQPEQLTALVTATTLPFSDASALAWTSTNTPPTIATVSPLGVVIAGDMQGIANIQVMDPFGDVGTVNITIGLPVVSPASASTSVGSTVQMSLVDPSNNPLALTPPWQWYSNRPSIATIDQTTGVVTGVAPGIATVYAQDQITSDTTNPAQITVSPYPSSTLVTPTPTSVPADGGPVTLTAVVSSATAPAGAPAATGTVTFTDQTSDTALCSKYALSSGTSVCPNVTVMAGDTVQAIYSGDANYAASTGSATIVGTENLTISPSAPTVAVGSTVTLSVSATDGSGNPIALPPNLQWTSSDLTIATVASGVVAGVAAGAATITVIDPESGATASVTVVVAPQNSTTCAPPAGASTCTITQYSPDFYNAGELVAPVAIDGTEDVNGTVSADDQQLVLVMYSNVATPCVIGTTNCPQLAYQGFSICSVDGNFVAASANSSSPYTYAPGEGCTGSGSGAISTNYAITSGGTLTMTSSQDQSGAFTCTNPTTTSTSSSQSQSMLSLSLVDGSGSGSFSSTSNSVTTGAGGSQSLVTTSGSGSWSGATNPASIFASMGLGVQTTSVPAGQAIPQACTTSGTISSTASRTKSLRALSALGITRKEHD